MAELTGSLFAWREGAESPMVAFESGDPKCPQKVIFLGGLTSGFFGCPYVPALHSVAQAHGWSLIQPLLSSSLIGYGTGSLARDTEELDALLAHLVQEHSATKFALVGHSTGCQQSAHFCNHGRRDLVARVAFVALQAPVSDREAGKLDAATAGWVQRAREMAAQGSAEELMPRAAHPSAPITAARYLSLFDVGGEDDFFSSDLSDAELARRLRAVGQDGRRVVIAFSEADEYVPAAVDRKRLVQRLCKAIVADSGCCLDLNPGEDGRPQCSQPTAACLLLPGANHALSLPADGSASAAFLRIVGRMLPG